jgi:hypothetical protein
MALTKTQQRVLDRMIQVAGQGTWTALPSQYGAVIRKTRTVETPEYYRGPSASRFARWDEPTYDQHLFLTMMSQGVILGEARAPWVGRQDSVVPYWLVELMLGEDADPFAVAENRIELARARRSGP